MVLLGLADAGAHVGQTMDASAPTSLLTYWVRERGLMPVEEAIRRLTSDTASAFGIDRGVLAPGAVADVNVIDFDGLALEVPEYVHDFPHGAGRFAQRARGYDYTVVAGEVFMDHGEHTGALPGGLRASWVAPLAEPRVDAHSPIGRSLRSALWTPSPSTDSSTTATARSGACRSCAASARDSVRSSAAAASAPRSRCSSTSPSGRSPGPPRSSSSSRGRGRPSSSRSPR